MLTDLKQLTYLKGMAAALFTGEGNHADLTSLAKLGNKETVPSF